MGETLRYGAIMLAAGIGIPVFAALNSQLGGRIGVPAAAMVVAFGVALAAGIVALALLGQAGSLARVPGHPPHLYLGGLLILFYVLSVTWVAPRFGVGNAIFFVLMGQMISAALIDQFGLFGAAVRPISLERLAGIGLMAGGLVLIQRG
jgi:bacterial/archaeal transporter family-2 protein